MFNVDNIRLPSTIKEKESPHAKKFNAYTLEGEYLATFQDITDCVKNSQKVLSVSVEEKALSAVLDPANRSYRHAGLQWRFCEEVNGTENIDSISNKSNKAGVKEEPDWDGVAQYDKQGKFIKRYDSLWDALKAVVKNYDSLSKEKLNSRYYHLRWCAINGNSAGSYHDYYWRVIIKGEQPKDKLRLVHSKFN